MQSMERPTSIRRKRTLLFFLFFFIVLMILSAYSNTFNSPPYLDDFHTFINAKDSYLHSLSLSAILALSKTQCGWTRFLPMVTFGLNHYLWNSKLFYFHLVNICIHLLAFFAVFWFVKEVIAAESKQRPLGQTPYEPAGFFALCVAAIWALSPVQTSAVTYMVQRMASMQALFFTLSAACFIKARLLSAKKSRAAAVFYFLCALAGICAGLSKQNSAMLPVVLVVIDIWFFDSGWLKKARDLLRKTGWKLRALGAAVFFGAFYYAFWVELPYILSGYAHKDFTLAQRLLTEARVVVWYMTLMLWPVPSRLSMEHDPRISTSLFHPLTTIPALLLIAALFFLAVEFRKRSPLITFGIVWFFLNLVIESTIVPIELVFEHRLYLPSAGFYLSVVAIVWLILRKGSKRLPQAEFAKAACSLLVVCAAFVAILTFLRNGVWKNAVTIRYDTVEKAPDSPRANADYANTLCQIGRYGEAMKYAEKAIKVGRKGREADSLAQNAITIALINQGKTGEAIKRDRKFLTRFANTPIDVSAVPGLCVNVFRACMNEKKPKEAYKWVLTGLKYVQLMGDRSTYKKDLIRNGLLELFSRYNAGDVDPALGAAVAPYLSAKSPAGGWAKTACSGPRASAAKMLSKEPGSCRVSMPAPRAQGDPAYPAVVAAMVFKAHGEEQYARGILEREYAEFPDDPLVKAQIAKFQKEDAQNLAQRKNWNDFRKYVRSPFSRFNFDMAVAYIVQKDQLPKLFEPIGKNRLDAALKIYPDSRDALLLKAWYLYNENEAAQAARDAEKILAGHPKDSKVWLALGFFLAKTGHDNRAVAAFKKVIELYPGYSQRAFLEQFCSRLSKKKNIESASLRR